MLTLKELLSTFEDRSILPSLVEKLVENGTLQTVLQPSEYSLLSLSDTELINRLNTPLLDYLLQTNNIHKVTRLTVIYDSLGYLHVVSLLVQTNDSRHSFSQEAEEYLLTLPQSSISFLASIPISESLMVNLAKEVQTKLPSELWREVLSKLESKRDISALTSTQSSSQREKKEYIAFRQYSILKGETGNQYYNKYFLTKFKVEMLNMMHEGYMKSIEDGEYMNDRYNIPDDDNQLVISIIFAMEFAKYYEHPNIVINLLSLDGIEPLLRDITPDYVVIDDNNIEITVISIAGNPVKVTISDDTDMNIPNALIIGVNRTTMQTYGLRYHRIVILRSRSNLKSYEEAEVTPVWVKTFASDQVPIIKGKNLILQHFSSLYPSKNKLYETKSGTIMSLQGYYPITWNLLKNFDNIIVKTRDGGPTQEIYSILSQHSTYPRNLIVIYDKRSISTYIPFPTKLINEMKKDGLGMELTLNLNRPSYCELTYVEMLVVTFYPLKRQDGGYTEPETDAVYDWMDSKIRNRVVSYTLPVAKGGTQSSFSNDYWKLQRIDNQTKENCWILMDPNQVISDKPLTK